MKKLANEDIRRFAAAQGVNLWQVSKKLGISDPTLTRRLRYELPEKEKTKYRSLIREIAKED